MKRYLILLGFLILPFKAQTASDCVSGEENCWECGTNCTARFNPDTKTFNVSGTGPMAELATGGQAANVPWASIRQSVEHITFDGAITGFSTYAFYKMNVNDVTIPDSVTYIGFGAFYKASSLKNVNIPDSVTYIDHSAFNKTGIESLVVPDSVRSIDGSNLLATNLENLVIGDQTKIIHTTETATNDNLKIYCTGNLTQCQQNAGIYADKVVQASTKKINGVTYVFDKKGNLCATSGTRENKRIYTIEEASIVSGEKNSLKIRYR